MIKRQLKGQDELDARLATMRLAVLTSLLQKQGAEVTVKDIEPLLKLGQSDQDIVATIRQRQSWLFKFRTSRIGALIGRRKT